MIHKSGLAFTGLASFLLFIATSSFTANTAHAEIKIGRLPVPGKAAIFDAGQTITTLDGLLPPVFNLSPGVGSYLEFTSVTGSVTPFLNTDPFVGPGGFGNRVTDLNSINGISGLVSVSAFFLTGVFLGESLPVDPAPPRLVYSAADTHLESYAPKLNQTFFIGDGLTGVGTGDPHRFIVPDGATRIFLGFADGGQFQGNPGAYADNYGYLDARFEIISSALSGDLNADGFMGIADLNIVLSHWNQNVTPGDFLLGDPSGDGFVGLDDLNFVLGNWNAGTPPSVNTPTAVPEPATLSILASSTLIFLRRRH